MASPLVLGAFDTLASPLFLGSVVSLAFPSAASFPFLYPFPTCRSRSVLGGITMRIESLGISERGVEHGDVQVLCMTLRSCFVIFLDRIFFVLGIGTRRSRASRPRKTVALSSLHRRRRRRHLPEWRGGKNVAKTMASVVWCSFPCAPFASLLSQHRGRRYPGTQTHWKHQHCKSPKHTIRSYPMVDLLAVAPLA